MTSNKLLELFHGSHCGMSPADVVARDLTQTSPLQKLSESDLRLLCEAYGFAVPSFDPQATYYLYYAWHPSSGYRTSFMLDESGSLTYTVHRPNGLVLRAFWSETVILVVVPAT